MKSWSCYTKIKIFECSSLGTLELIGEIPGGYDDEIVFCSTVKVLCLVNLCFCEK